MDHMDMILKKCFKPRMHLQCFAHVSKHSVVYQQCQTHQRGVCLLFHQAAFSESILLDRYYLGTQHRVVLSWEWCRFQLPQCEKLHLLTLHFQKHDMMISNHYSNHMFNFVKCANLWTLFILLCAFVIFLAFHDVTSDKSFNLNLFISDKHYLENVSHKIR